MSITTAAKPVGTVYLRPRPYVRGSGVMVLVPLIVGAPRRPHPTLPPEIWHRVLAFVFSAAPGAVTAEERRARLRLMRVSRMFKNLAAPLLYARPHLAAAAALHAFARVLLAAEAAWDSLRRIPHSAPGRWVRALDVTRVACGTPAERLALDTLLARVLALTPFLARAVLPRALLLSRRVLAALAELRALRVLKGGTWAGAAAGAACGGGAEDALLQLVRASAALEELELCGPGLQDDDAAAPARAAPPLPLRLPRLHTLTLLALPRAPLLAALVRSALPALRHLMVTPYDDVPGALTSALVAAHGAALATLAFHTPKAWPPRRHAAPAALLHAAPALQALALAQPLPPLAAPPAPHPLRVLSLPRPDAACLRRLEAWLARGRLPRLEEVHMRDTRWIRAGVSPRAAEAGVQGEMRDWARRLARWRVRVLDVDGRTHEG